MGKRLSRQRDADAQTPTLKQRFQRAAATGGGVGAGTLGLQPKQVATTAIWEWDNSGSWERYSAADSARIESAFQAKRERLEMDFAGKKYELQLKPGGVGEQINKSTHFRRNIRRSVPATANPPSAAVAQPPAVRMGVWGRTDPRHQLNVEEEEREDSDDDSTAEEADCEEKGMRLSGTVIKFEKSKSWGILRAEDGTKYWFQMGWVEKPYKPAVNDTVDFTVGSRTKAKLPHARDITRPRTGRRYGVLNKWIDRGFGFINEVKGSDIAYFFHISDTVPDRFTNPPAAGSVMEFDLEPSPGRPGKMKAVKVAMKGVRGGYAPGPARRPKSPPRHLPTNQEIDRELRALKQEARKAQEREKALQQQLAAADEEAKKHGLRPPPHWENTGCRFVPVGGSLKVFENIVKGKRVLHCWRLEHQQRWGEYAMRRETVRQELRNAAVPNTAVDCALICASLPDQAVDKSVNESWLMHGTNLECMQHIMENGFNERYCNDHGLYGAGCYFAEDVDKCLNYAKASTLGELASACPWSASELARKMSVADGQIQFVFVARCTLGWFAQAGAAGTYKQHDGSPLFAAGHRQLALNPSLPPYHFHALVAPRGASAHREFVIYDGKQAYPAYILAIAKA